MLKPPSEDASCWENCFESLKARGLKGVKLVTSDGHKDTGSCAERIFRSFLADV